MPNYLGLIQISPKRYIGGLTAMATLEEKHTDELQITEHPIEQGANINDHAFKRPAEVVIRCGWSDSSLSGLFRGVMSAVKSIRTRKFKTEDFGPSALELSDGSKFGSDYVSAIYNHLLALQESRIPFDVATGKRLYPNMLMRSLTMTTDGNSEFALMCTVVCRQVIIVQTQATTLPPREDQAMPEATGSVVDLGARQLVQVFKAPGGWQPPNG